MARPSSEQNWLSEPSVDKRQQTIRPVRKRIPLVAEAEKILAVAVFPLELVVSCTKQLYPVWLVCQRRPEYTWKIKGAIGAA
jgi:hypothetical protein